MPAAFKKAPAAKKRAAPKKKASTTYPKKDNRNKENVLSLPYSLSYLSAFGKNNIHDNESQARYVPVPLVSRFTFQTSTTLPKVFIYNPSMQGVYNTLKFDSTGAFIYGDSNVGSRLATEPCTTSRTLLASLRIQNSSRADSVGSVVRGLISPPARS